jgi:hypothetical protein
VTPKRQKRRARTFKGGEDVLRSIWSILLGSKKHKLALIERKQVARDNIFNLLATAESVRQNGRQTKTRLAEHISSPTELHQPFESWRGRVGSIPALLLFPHNRDCVQVIKFSPSLDPDFFCMAICAPWCSTISTCIGHDADACFAAVTLCIGSNIRHVFRKADFEA